MQEERLQVLKMIDEGKISVDEATKLLDALKSAGGQQANFEEKFNAFARDTKEFFKDVGNKINEMYKEAEPKIKEATKTVVAKTATLADNISQSLNEKAKKMDSGECCADCCPDYDDAPADNGPPPEDK
jgi:polyhydroxyalkanoate synthesis regulator phasin